MNKNELIAAIQAMKPVVKLDVSKTAVTTVVDAVFDAVTAALKKGEEVRLVGFGTFLVTKRAKTKGRNPRTGEEIMIPASKQPKFKAGKGLKEAVN